jgi:hypothetical protein
LRGSLITKKFTVAISEGDFLQQPQEVLNSLRNVSPSEIFRMQRLLREVRQFLLYDSPHEFNPVCLAFMEAFMRRVEFCNRTSSTENYASTTTAFRTGMRFCDLLSERLGFRQLL